jgi:RNA polymerase sigma factor (sigma-70 family)
MIGEEELTAMLTGLGGQVDDPGLADRAAAGFGAALRRLRDDPAEAARIDALGTKGDNDRSLAALVTRAIEGDPAAWDEMVERYAPLVWSRCAQFGLSNSDRQDVAQSVWLLLVDHLGRLREPAALPGWLATTTHRECLRVVTAARRSEQAARRLPPGDPAAIDGEILAVERNSALLAAFDMLPPRSQQLLVMLMADPPRSYAQIGAALQIPVGSIGPTRARILGQLRRSIALPPPKPVPRKHPAPTDPEPGA